MFDLEIWDGYLEDGTKAGVDLVRGEKIPQGLFHIVCEVLVRHQDGDYLLMQRDSGKEVHAGEWEATAGGSALKGEDALTCIRRELEEETGLCGKNFEQIGSGVNRERGALFCSYFCEVDAKKDSVRLQAGETIAYRWVSEREFIAFINSGEMTPGRMQRCDSYFRKHGYLKEDEVAFAFCQYRRNMADKEELDDTLLKIHEKEEWIRALQHRAECFQEIFQENEAILKQIRGWLESPLSAELAERLYAQAENMYIDDCDDYILLETASTLMKYYEERNDYIKLMRLYAIMDYETNEFRERHTGRGQLSSVYARKIIALKDHYREFAEVRKRRGFFVAYYNYIVIGLANRLVTVDESYRLLSEMEELWSSAEVQELDAQEELVRGTYEQVKLDWFCCEEWIAEASESTQRSFCRLARQYYASESGDKGDLVCSNDVYTAYLHALVIEGEISWREAVERYFTYYRARVDKYRQECKLENEEFYFLINVPVNMMRWLSQDVPGDLKMRVIEALAEDTKTVLYPRLERKITPFINETLTKWCFQILPYLEGQGREEWLLRLLVQRQLPTYLHSVMVKNLAMELLRTATEERPDLFARLPEEISGERLPEFVRMCALLHDIGKTKITTIITTQTRKLEDEEFLAIRKHPQYGEDLMAELPELNRYRDIILGHHKFYDGSGGYPENFDNTASPYRILIDLITICDCLDAATDGMGRNYKNEKSFDQVLQEFVRDKGVRYNPDLVEVIEGSQELRERLAAITGPERVDTVYEIYSHAG